MKMNSFCLLFLILVFSSCSHGSGGGNAHSYASVSFENKIEESVVFLGMEYVGSGRVDLPPMVVGPGASKTIFGEIGNIVGEVNIIFTKGRIGSGSYLVSFERINYSGDLDKLLLRLNSEERWSYIGFHSGRVVFEANELNREFIIDE